MNATKDGINTKQGLTISEEIADEIRCWFEEYKKRTGKLPEFPTEECGGSRHLLSRQGTESEISRSSALSSKESRRTKDKPKIPTQTGEIKIEDSVDLCFKASQSLFLPDIKLGIDE